MRTICSCLLVLVSSASCLWGQAVEERKSMSLGTYPGHTLSVQNLDAKEVEQVWEAQLKSLGGSAPKKKKGEYFVDNGNLNLISKNPVDLYSTVEKKGSQVLLTVWFDLGGGAFLNRQAHPEQVRQLGLWFDELNERFRVRIVELEIEAEEKKLNEMNRELDRLKKDQEKLNQTIVDSERKIEEAKKDLETNADQQEQQAAQILTQQKNLEQVRQKLRKQ